MMLGHSRRTAVLSIVLGCGLGPLLLAVSGCSASGGSITVCPHEHKLLDSAEDAARWADRYAPIPRELQKVPLEAYYVQPGDVLLLEITDLDTDIRLPVDQPILPDGTIDLAEYGRPVVAGMTVEQIEELVHGLVQAGDQEADVPPINVRLTVTESAVFYVLGEVNAPGAYPLIGRETVLDALMTAGGLSDRASDCGMILSRPTPAGCCHVVLPICYRQIIQLGDTTTNYQIQPGDRIFVSTRSLCEQLMFWHKECDLCPESCIHPCPTPITPSYPPFVLQEPSTAPPYELDPPPFPPIDAEPLSASTHQAPPIEQTPEELYLAPPVTERPISTDK